MAVPTPKKKPKLRQHNWYLEKLKECPRCKGKGHLVNYKHQDVQCTVCDGTGKVTPI